MAYEHPRGAGPFVGPQLHGGFGAWLAGRRRVRGECAASVPPPGSACRRAHLHRVLGLCRLLVRPDAAASHVLGRVVRAVGDDCEGLPAPGCWRRSSTRPNRRGRACARRTGFGWVRPAVAVAGTARTRRWKPQGGVYVRLGAVVAHPLGGARSGRGAAGGWRRSRRRLGGPRVRRGAVGRRASERAAGASAQQMAESMRAITGAAHGARALVKGHYRLIDQPADS